jgi:hypothetical protein
MVLVEQVYAPIDDLERSLYVFCCNTRQCSLQSDGWVVVRNQSCCPKPVPVAIVPQPVVAAATSSSKKATSVWDFLSEDLSGDSLTGDDSLLLDLLSVRDQNLHASAQTSSNNSGASKKAGDTSLVGLKVQQRDFLVTPSTLPVSRIKAIEEDWDPSYDRDEDDDDGNDDHRAYNNICNNNSSSNNLTSSGVSENAHIDSLIARYLQDEDEDNLVALSSLGVGVGNSTTARAVATSQCVAKLCLEEECDEDESDGRQLASDDQVELYFQRRIQLEPQQVLRYAYDGQPLWISPQKGLDVSSTIDLCECCQSRRVFECQLMPALLSHLSKAAGQSQTSVGAVTADISNNDNSKLRDIRSMGAHLLGDGLDFGVVTVWSCPNSCESTIFERAVVQCPPDIGL